MSNKDTIIEDLTTRALIAIEGICEAEFNKHHKHMGKIGIVDRVRAGKVQMRKKKSDEKGYKIQNGAIVKMTPEERRKRRIAGKITARRVRGKIAQTLRKRKVSLRVRGSRLGEEAWGAE